MKLTRLMTMIIVLLIIAAAFAIYGMARPNPTITSYLTPNKTTPTEYGATSYQVTTVTTRNPSGEMNLMLGVSQGARTNINITLSESFVLAAPLPWICNSLTDNLGMCTGCYEAMYGNPVRIAIYQGHYDQQNLTDASPVLVSDSTEGCYGGTVAWSYYPPGITTSAVTITSGPTTVTVTQSHSINSSASAHLTFGGHRSDGSSTYTYARGVYTILGVDVWGDVAVMYVTLTD